ncbi:MAG: hypothetical protein R3301_15955 [Saprospiraceae bacterium]|nr:hypothetical protein [Saprospiraceae bacterium]
MQHWRIKLALFINYFVFAILLNSVGILIQKSINVYGVDEVAASSLEAFKDLSIAAVSSFVFPLIGLFLAPIYPLMNAGVLGSVDKAQYSALAGLLTFFSGVGGTLGSRLVGYLFREIGGAPGLLLLVGADRAFDRPVDHLVSSHQAPPGGSARCLA